MADKILFKRSSNTGVVPTISDLMLGEIALNLYDGKIFTRRQYEVEGDPVDEIVSFVSKVPVGNTFYVSVNGDDDNNEGTTWERAYATIERAIQEVELRGGLPTLIDIGPGIYYTQGHIDMPDNCAIRSVHRTVFIRPVAGFEQRNVFRMGSGCFIEGLMVEGFEVDDFDNPTEGFAFSFRPGAVIVRAPYAHKCAIRRIPSWDYIAPPLDRNNGNPLVGRGGGVVLADGDVCSPYSIFPNIMTWGATPVTQNGIGYCAKNGALINAVNAVSIWAHKHFYALNGGQIILSACSTQFGDYTMVAKGTRNIVYPIEIENTTVLNPIKPSEVTVVYPTGSTIAPFVNSSLATEIQTAKTTIIDDMWINLDGLVIDWTAEQEALTRRDAGTFLDAITRTFQTGDESYLMNFARGLFYYDGTLVYTPDKRTAFFQSFDFMVGEIKSLTSSGTSEDELLDALLVALKDTLDNPVTYSVTPLVNSSAATQLLSSKTALVNGMWNALVAEGYTAGWTAEQEAFTKRDAGTLIDDIVKTLNSGDEAYISFFLKSLYNNGTAFFPSNQLLAFLFCYNYLRDQIVLLSNFDSNTDIFIHGITNALNYTIRYPNIVAAPNLSVQTTAATAVTNAKTTIINNVWNALVSGGYTTGWNAEDETFTRRDTGTLLQCISWVLQSGNEKPMMDFAKGLFDTIGGKVYTADKESAFIFSFNIIKEQISLLTDVSNDADIIVDALITALIKTITNPTLRVEPSTITAIGHTWTGVLAGVALTKIPPVRNQANIQDSILELEQGNVIASGQDDQGSAIFVGGLEINADTGELGGPPFDTAVNRIATKAAIARSF